MSPRSDLPFDEASLSESAYEFIDTDEESRDDNATESVASTDFGRPYDVASLAGSEHSDDDSEDEQNPIAASTSGYTGFDSLADDTPTIGRSSAVLLDELDRSFTHSIEFEEPFKLGAENVSVKHTVSDFDENESAMMSTSLQMLNPPKRLVLTVRQTMAKGGLSTKDPLGILYFGSHSARQDILRKIGQAMHATVDNKPQSFRRTSPSQIYNVVPISAFGSEQTPEIELMHSSGPQMKVENCSYAEAQQYENRPEKPAMIKLHIEDGLPYNSVPNLQGFKIEPPGDLPHIAIFYCSDNDDLDARRTRTIARKFLSRHNIPSIVISHKKLLDRPNTMTLDQHSLHMCLESRDPSGRGSIIHHRIPIDLESFLNIDARQMSRNLAYLTGLHEIIPTIFRSRLSEITPDRAYDQNLEKTDIISSSPSTVRESSYAFFRALLPVGLLLLSIFAAVLTGVPSYRSVSQPHISVNSKAISIATKPSTSTTEVTDSISCGITASTSAATKTATCTITVVETKSPEPNSLSALSSMDFRKLAKSPSKTRGKINVLGAEILGDHEILIRSPSATKLGWLANEVMSVNVTRGNHSVDIDRIYSSSEGFVLSLAKNQAYGILNISILTTTSPRVSGSFSVDFGSKFYQTLHSVWDHLSVTIPGETTLNQNFNGYNGSLAQIRNAFGSVANLTIRCSHSAQELVEGTKRALGLSNARATEFAKSVSFEAAKRSAILSKELSIQLSAAENRVMKNVGSLQEPFSNGLLSAQVRAKLLWLKMQGKHTEHDQYKSRAVLAARNLKEAKDLEKDDSPASRQQKKTQMAAKKAVKEEARAGKQQHR